MFSFSNLARNIIHRMSNAAIINPGISNDNSSAMIKLEAVNKVVIFIIYFVIA